MKRTSYLVLIALLLIGAYFIPKGFALLTTTMTDIWAIGNDGSGGPLYRLASDGGVITAGANTLSGTTTLSGATTISGDVTRTAKTIITPIASQTVAKTAQLSVTGNFMIITSTALAVTNTAAPFISTATATNPNGTHVIIMGGSDTDIITVTDSAAFALGAATRALGVGDILELIIYNGIWYEIGFTNN